MNEQTQISRMIDQRMAQLANDPNEYLVKWFEKNFLEWTPNFFAPVPFSMFTDRQRSKRQTEAPESYPTLFSSLNDEEKRAAQEELEAHMEARGKSPLYYVYENSKNTPTNLTTTEEQ